MCIWRGDICLRFVSASAKGKLGNRVVGVVGIFLALFSRSMIMEVSKLRNWRDKSNFCSFLDLDSSDG